MKPLLWLSSLTALAAIAPAQDWYPKHNFTVGIGAGVPQADLQNAFDPKVGVRVGYGYRFHRNFQADIGFDTIFGAGNVREFVNTQLGFTRLRDYQYFLPMGGRTIIPLLGGRLEFHAGGGGAYLRYQEQIRQPSEFVRLACPYCSSRSGWGYYGMAGFSVALDQAQHFRLGVTPMIYRGTTNGQGLGNVPAFETRDKWINVMAEFRFSF
jgi:hypothetical protein